MYAQTGRVGINTTNPAAALHVVDSSVLFSSTLTTSTLPYPPVQGPGSRMMWFSPRKSFRVGRVQGTHWDRDSIGLYSFAANYNTIGSGDYSSAFGYDTRARGLAAASFGQYTVAEGDVSFATGLESQARGSGSVAMGYANLAEGDASTALGFTTMALGMASFSSGMWTEAIGGYSSAFGVTSKAIGEGSTAFGNSVWAKAYTMFAVGSFNDTTNCDPANWVLTDPLFVVGNGLAGDRKNALTLLKNGNLGLHTKNPVYRLHITNSNPDDGGYAEGIMIENTNTAVGEAALSFRNKSLPSNKQWTIGMNQNPSLAFSYGINFDAGNTRMVIDTFGRVGINIINPQAQLHVVRNGTSGGPFSANSMAVFESNTTSYIQFSSENADENGILSGNQDHYIRSGIIFRADSSIHFRTGGNTTRMVISTAGNVGIGTSSPAAKLHVNGTTRFGVNGNTITEIIRATVNANVPSVAANGGTVAQLFTVTNAALTSAVSVSPNDVLTAGLVIASARVSAANTIEVRFVNTTAAAIDPPAMDFHFTVIR
jgi:hypothetical protein